MIWENSMSCAMCATLVSKKLKRPFVEEIFLLGLLHSLGQIVLLAQKETSKDYDLVLKAIAEKNLDYHTAEQEVFGFGHPLIGALVAKKWNFSADTCQVILHYRDQVDADKPDGLLEQKIAIVQLSDLISHAAMIGSPEGYKEPADEIKALITYLGFEGDPEEVMQELVETTKQQFEAEGSIYD
jgi:HD-like signal output (HDOD) protein